jgi:hypothetical protein
VSLAGWPLGRNSLDAHRRLVRLGIVLSVARIVGAGMYQNNEDLRKAEDFYQFPFKLCEQNKEVRLNPKNVDCSLEAQDETRPFREARLGDVLIVAFVPVSILWLVVFLTLSIYRWLRRGFLSLS